jgi:hypothetical protein
MLTPLPSKIEDPKDIVLWALFDRLQRIDENPTTRLGFATQIAYSNHTGLNHPVFAEELGAIRQLLNIPVLKEEEAPVTVREEIGIIDNFKDDL